jgi:hypothetical protein
MNEEILNIEYHKVRLIILSLNTSKTARIAAMKCGISTKCLYNYIKIYNIHQDGKRWISNQLMSIT